MASVPQLRLTPAEYLALDRAAERRSEFFDGVMYAMSGASYRHIMIVGNLAFELTGQLRGGPCRALTNDLRVALRNGNYFYPDLVVVCGKPRFLDGEFDTLLNPEIVIEVLSPSNQGWDRNGKFAEYRQVASLRHYISVRQDAPAVERHDRQDDDSWQRTDLDGLDQTLTFASIGAAVPLSEIYRDIFSAAG